MSMTIIPSSLPDRIISSSISLATDPDAWFITTNADAGLTSFKREGYSFTTDNDFDTENAKAKGYERYASGWTDWRGCYGTAGA